MRVLVQRVSRARVWIEGAVRSEIGRGLLIFVGIETADSGEDIGWLCNKIGGLRIFEDAQGVMNLSVKDISGEVLVVSQFTLHARIKKGFRPSYIDAAPPVISIPLYEQFVESLVKELGRNVGTGEFGAMMQIELVNDGPVTIWMDSKNKL